MEIRELFGKDYSAFEEIDPYNKKNTLSGVISRKPNEYYGALIINQVNGKTVSPQLIMGTPKMHYPFDSRADGSRNYAFPKANKIEIYVKLDGTNVLAYLYYDQGGYPYLTFKTRLTPFLHAGRFGDFYSMWNEVAESYFQEIRQRMVSLKCNLSFELYGAKNPHLIAYKNNLDFALLFGVTSSGSILSPNDLAIDNLPKVKLYDTIDKDYVYNYERIQKELQGELKKAEDENYYYGTEGTVWYIKTIDNRCIQLKCKPETIEMIHFSAGAGGLDKNTIIATCWNAFENTDVITVDFIKHLLLEEFKPEIIEANTYKIQACIDFVTRESVFRKSVLEAYKKTGKNILLDKSAVMRELSSQFTSERMQKVYSTIMMYS